MSQPPTLTWEPIRQHRTIVYWRARIGARHVGAVAKQGTEWRALLYAFQEPWYQGRRALGVFPTWQAARKEVGRADANR